MAEINAQQTTSTLIAYTVSTDKNALVSLLKRNGIVLPNNPSDKEVTIATLKALKSSTFKNDLSALLGRKVSSAAQDFASFTGIDDFGGIENYFNATAAEKRAAAKAGRVTADNPKGKTGVGLFLQNLGKSISSQDTINQGLNIGLTAINNKVQAQNNNLTTEANNIIQKSDEITKQIPAATTKKNNTLTYVFVGVGVLALIGIVYFVAKKK
jgi:hypothetical protein